jgi:transposase-like protein
LRRMELWGERVSSRRSCGSGRCGWSRRSRRTIPSQWAAITAVAEKLGIGTAETLWKWVRRAEVDDGTRPGLTSQEHAEIKRLKRRSPSCAGRMRS